MSFTAKLAAASLLPSIVGPPMDCTRPAPVQLAATGRRFMPLAIVRPRPARYPCGTHAERDSPRTHAGAPSMIGRLRGTVAEVGEEDALIDVMGVGYVVRCGARTLSRLPAVGDEALLHVESQFGEQTGLTLYGFLAREDRRAFVLLRTIQGVGPKAALAVL